MKKFGRDEMTKSNRLATNLVRNSKANTTITATQVATLDMFPASNKHTIALWDLVIVISLKVSGEIGNGGLYCIKKKIMMDCSFYPPKGDTRGLPTRIGYI